MRMITALTRGRNALIRKDWNSGSLYTLRSGVTFGEFAPEFGRFHPNDVVGVCALGALYLGLAEAKKGYEKADSLAADAALILAVGTKLATEGETALRADYEYEVVYRRRGDSGGFVTQVPTFAEWMLSGAKAMQVATFNDEIAGDKEAVIEAFDLAIEFARTAGL